MRFFSLECCFFLASFASEEKSDTSSKAASPAKKRRTTATATSSKSLPSAAAVQSLYASVLGPSHSNSQSRSIRTSAALEVLSSEEEGRIVHVPTKEEKFEKPWFDAARGCMVRSIPGKAGVVEEADMKPGDSGFLVAIFPGEEELETEVPNSLISSAKGAKPSVPKAKAKAKGQAKAKAKGKAKAKAKVKAAATKAKAKAVQRPKPRLQLALNNVLLSDTIIQRLASVVSGKSSLRDIKCLSLEICQSLRLICMKLQINASLDCLPMICPRQMRKSGACKDVGTRSCCYSAKGSICHSSNSGQSNALCTSCSRFTARGGYPPADGQPGEQHADSGYGLGHFAQHASA